MTEPQIIVFLVAPISMMLVCLAIHLDTRQK